MNWELFDFCIEVLKTLVLFFITIFLLWAGRDRNTGQQGWKLIVAGFALLTFAGLLDISDEFSSLSRFVIIGDTPIQSFLEKVVGYSGGYLLVLCGLLSWIPTLKEMTTRLQHQVEERTAELLKSKKFIESILQHSHDLIDVHQRWLIQIVLRYLISFLELDNLGQLFRELCIYIVAGFIGNNFTADT